MNFKNKSNSKLSPLKNDHNISVRENDRMKREKDRKTQNRSKSHKSLRSKGRESLSKSKGKPSKEQKQGKFKIEKQYTKSSYKRFQQKLSIFTKIEELISEINDRQSKVKTYFQIYRILDSEMGQQRCLQHNNDLSLYCQTEGKVLCVHCIYGESRHKTHKVIPLKDSIKHISSDITHLQTTIKQDLETIKIKVKISETNEKFIQKNYQQQLHDLQKVYVQKLREIESDFCQKKEYVKEYFESLIQKNSQLTNALKQFGKSVSIKLSILNKDQLTYRLQVKQVSKQTILSKIADFSNLNGLSLENMDEKDIGQNCLRNRIKSVKK